MDVCMSYFLEGMCRSIKGITGERDKKRGGDEEGKRQDGEEKMYLDSQNSVLSVFYICR